MSMPIQKSSLPTIYCKHDQSILQAAIEYGYCPPKYRVGVVQDAKPRDGEVMVAYVKAMRYSLPMPIFMRKDTLKEGVDETATPVLL